MTDYYVRKTGNDTTGDGSTGTPWLTIQKALDTVSIAGGHTIYVGAGTYAESASANQLSLARTFLAEVIVRPEAGATVVITGQAAGAMSILISTNAANYTFDGIGSSGSSLSIQPASTQVLTVRVGNNNTNISNIKFANCTIQNANNATAILMTNCAVSGLTLENVTTSAPNGCQFSATTTGYLNNFTFTNTNMSGTTYALRILPAARLTNWSISGGTYTVSASGAISIDVRAITGTISTWSFNGVTTGGNGNGFIANVSGSGVIDTLVFTNCTMYHPDWDAFRITSAVDDVQIVGGTYTGSNKQTPNSTGAIEFQDNVGLATNILIDGATLYNAGGLIGESVYNGHAIGFEGVNGAEVRNCTITGSGTARGIALRDNAKNITIHDNIMDGWAFGVRIGNDSTGGYDVDGVTIYDNTMNCDTAGLIIGSAAKNVSIYNNTINGGTYGIRFRGDALNSNILVYENTIGCKNSSPETRVAALGLLNANNGTFDRNIITGEWPYMFIAEDQDDGRQVQDVSFTGNTIKQSGSGSMFNLPLARIGVNLYFDFNRYKFGSGGWGIIPTGDVNTPSMSALRSAWSGYGDGTNDAISTRIDAPRVATLVSNKANLI